MRLNFNASTGPVTKVAPLYQWDQDTDGWVTFCIEGQCRPARTCSTPNLMPSQELALSPWRKIGRAHV